VRRRIAGVVFLLVISLLVSLTILVYRKAFTPVVHVSLETDRAGNQLSAPADVKLRGLVVGEVRKVSTRGEGAVLDLALDPGKVALIPNDVQAQLLPKTLFGEKYVELVIPAQPAGEHLREGDVIPQDRSSVAMETQRVLDDVMPLLRSLKPVQLSMTLNALSLALRDRGDALGANLARSGAYFRELNPSVPTIGDDMRGLADFADTVSAVTPELLTTLDNFSFSSRSLVDQRAELDSFLTRTATFADTARQIVAENESRLVALSRDALPVLTLFARYSPEYPCFLKGLADYHPIVEKTFGGLQPGLHLTLEINLDRGGYAPGQEPKYRDDRAPYCDGLPTPSVPAGNTQFDDGYQSSTTPTPSKAQGFEGSALALVAAPVLGVSADQVPDVVGLLLGPLAGGNTVGLRTEGGA
jgi:virulence factor Mce-like protein